MVHCPRVIRRRPVHTKQRILESLTFHSSLNAVSQAYSLGELIDKARDLRQRLQAWFINLPDSLQLRVSNMDENDDYSIRNQASLHMAYFTTQTLVFRVLLRPILNQSIDLSHMQTQVEAILKASQSLIHMMIKLVRGLDARDFSAYWPVYTRTCFCYPGQLGLMLCLQSREADTSKLCQRLLASWRQVLRIRAQSWPFLRIGAVTVDAIYWKNLDKLASGEDRAS